MPRLLLLLPSTSYRIDAFLEAAARSGAEVAAACDRQPALASLRPGDLLALDFTDPMAAAKQAAALARERPFDAVLGVDDATAVVAAAIAAELSLPRRNPIEAARVAGNKRLQRESLAAAGLPVPWHRAYPLDGDPARAAAEFPYPCVLKPLVLAASRGVLRADDPDSFVAAFRRIARILEDSEIARRGADAREILVESFVAGREIALEALLVGGRLHPLALFDKPDPLEGPTFEETIYVTPSRLAEETQRAIVDSVSAAARTMGLREGPVHAECRIASGAPAPAGRATHGGPPGAARGARAPVILEVAARSIGGLCSRAIRFVDGGTLEDVIVRHALGLPAGSLAREPLASGVMMIPIPRGGTLEGVRGKEDARAVPLIEDVAITAHPGQTLVPLPEGSRYLGFIFARGETPDAVEEALRRAHARLEFIVR